MCHPGVRAYADSRVVAILLLRIQSLFFLCLCAYDCFFEREEEVFRSHHIPLSTFFVFIFFLGWQLRNSEVLGLTESISQRVA